MSFEIAAAASAAIGPGAAGSASMPTQVGFGTPTQVGYGVSLNDIGGFNQALARIEARPVAATSEAARQLMTPFEHINKEAVRPMWQGGQFVPRTMMNLSSSFDHRVIDGYVAARFVQRIKGLIEAPATLFIEE